MPRASGAHRKRLTANQILLLILLLALALGVASGALDRATEDRFDLSVWGMVAGFPLVLALTVMWWLRLDEAAREAHKWAWYWGATGGILASFPLLMGVSAAKVVSFAGRIGMSRPEELVAFGVLAVLTLQLVGYGLAWAAWWLRRR